MSDKCPKCGASRNEEAATLFVCGSFPRAEGSKFGGFHQSDKCRIAELEQRLCVQTDHCCKQAVKLVDLEAENARLREDAARLKPRRTEESMTMPHLMNCAHSEDGWCLACVKSMHEAIIPDDKELDIAVSKLERLIEKELFTIVDHDADVRTKGSEGFKIKWDLWNACRKTILVYLRARAMIGGSHE